MNHIACERRVVVEKLVHRSCIEVHSRPLFSQSLEMAHRDVLTSWITNGHNGHTALVSAEGGEWRLDLMMQDTLLVAY